MKFGIRFIGYVANMREIVELSVLSEQAGFEYAWYPHDTFMYNTWVTTSAVAERTRKIKIGSVGTNPYTTSPAEIATYLATLDELSGGRAVLGLGLHTEKMVEWTGIDASHYISRTREAAEIIRALLRGEVVDYQGQEFQWSDQCYLRFKPLRERVPIYICAFGEEYLRLSGEIGDGSLPMITPPAAGSVLKVTSPRLAVGEFVAGDPKFKADNGTIAVATSQVPAVSTVTPLLRLAEYCSLTTMSH